MTTTTAFRQHQPSPNSSTSYGSACTRCGESLMFDSVNDRWMVVRGTHSLPSTECVTYSSGKDEIVQRHVLGLPHPCDGTNHETHLTEEQREAASWQRAELTSWYAETEDDDPQDVNSDRAATLQ